HGSDRSLQLDRLSIVTGPIAALAMPAALGLVLGVEAEVQQRVLMRASDQVYIAAAPPVAAAGPAARDILLPAKGQASVAAVAGLYIDFYFVNEQGVVSDLDSSHRWLEITLL